MASCVHSFTTVQSGNRCSISVHEKILEFNSGVPRSWHTKPLLFFSISTGTQAHKTIILNSFRLEFWKPLHRQLSRWTWPFSRESLNGYRYMSTGKWQKQSTKSAPIVFALFRLFSIIFDLFFALFGLSVSDRFLPSVFALFAPFACCHLATAI